MTTLLELKIRNLIAAREFNTASANRELNNGGWLWDHGAYDKHISDEIDVLVKELEAAL